MRLIPLNNLCRSKWLIAFAWVFTSHVFACNYPSENGLKSKDSLFYYEIPLQQLEDFKFESGVLFWHHALQLSSDSVLIYTQINRRILATLPKKDVLYFNDSCCKDSVFHNYRFNNNLPYHIPLRYLEGKSNFYQWGQVQKYIKPAGDIFIELEVNPILAQLVLLIECPADPNGKSIAGAVGHFQLMPYVAKKYGLKVSQGCDERTDLTKGSYAAAMHFKKYCIPLANKILTQHHIAIEADQLWYQLFLLHIYNAGAGNVAKVMDVIPASSNGVQVIKHLWSHTAGGFKNASQNYTQIALAAYLNFISKP